MTLCDQRGNCQEAIPLMGQLRHAENSSARRLTLGGHSDRKERRQTNVFEAPLSVAEPMALTPNWP
jgi:hypothetical protein